MKNEKIAVIGLGYVGLPVALAFARRFEGTIGMDIDPRRIEALRRGYDATGEVETEALQSADLALTETPEALRGATCFIVTVPTPLDAEDRPDLTAMKAASRTVGAALQAGGLVIYESTVYPGVTEEICGPILAEVSGLTAGVDFHLGYSPERINPGDREHAFERVVKVVSGDDPETTDRVAALYSAVVDAGVHRAPSIRVAEAAKVIENTQRDLNIAFMNELALIFDRMGISTRDVLAAAGTKWNFLPFVPGLVGGHCIGVDPYYLTAKAQALGYRPEVILAGRRINDDMGRFIGRKLVKLLASSDGPIRGARVAVLGLTFKENVPDLRNSRVPDIIAELAEFGIVAVVHDPMASPAEAADQGITLTEWDAIGDVDAIVLAVDHAAYRERSTGELLAPLREGGVIIDVKSALNPDELPAAATYWSL